jgi:hypothetical protein
MSKNKDIVPINKAIVEKSCQAGFSNTIRDLAIEQYKKVMEGSESNRAYRDHSRDRGERISHILIPVCVEFDRPMLAEMNKEHADYVKIHIRDKIAQQLAYEMVKDDLIDNFIEYKGMKVTFRAKLVIAKLSADPTYTEVLLPQGDLFDET